MKDTATLRAELAEKLEREWKDPEIQAEFFGDFGCFEAFKIAEAQGLIKFKVFEREKDGIDFEKIVELIEKPPYRDLESVKRLVARLRSRAAGKGRRGTEGPVRTAIRVIRDHYDVQTFDALLATMDDLAENQESMADLVENRSNPCPLYILAVDRKRKMIEWRPRKGKEEGQTTFKTIQNHFSEIKPA